LPRASKLKLEGAMFIDHDITLILGPALIALLIAGILGRFLQRGEADPINHALGNAED
jgi:hypothetical protein